MVELWPLNYLVKHSAFSQFLKKIFNKSGMYLETILLQVVWKASKRVGFGIATGSDGMTKVVAQYQPCGNMNFNTPSGAKANVDMGDSKEIILQKCS